MIIGKKGRDAIWRPDFSAGWASRFKDTGHTHQYDPHLSGLRLHLRGMFSHETQSFAHSLEDHKNA